MRNRPLPLLVAFAFGALACRRPGPVESAPCTCPEGTSEDTLCAQLPDAHAGVSVLAPEGCRVDWSAADGLLAFDQKGPDGYYDVHVMRPDGSERRCLTCDGAAPPRHDGNPAWHPSGELLVFQAELAQHRGSSNPSQPGLGVRMELWLHDLRQGTFHRLTQTADDDRSGVLHPHFSPDGRTLAWTRMRAPADLLRAGQEAGYWELMVADFRRGPEGFSLENPRALQPLGEGFYESHGFDPSGRRLYFSSNAATNPGTPVYKRSDLWTVDLLDGTVQRLTDEDYNEHAAVSPDGRWVAWMSSRGDERGTDYWVMAADGSQKRRLTSFNRPGSPHATGETLTAADASWSPDSRRLAAYVFYDLLRQDGRLLMLSPFCAPP